MRVAAAFLAEAVTVHKGMVNALSGFVVGINRKEFPAPIGLKLVVVIEYDSDEARMGHIERSFQVECKPLGGGKSLFTATGEYKIDCKDDSFGYVPTIFNLDQMVVPMPGSYRIVFEGEGLEQTAVMFYANAIDLPQLNEEQTKK